MRRYCAAGRNRRPTPILFIAGFSPRQNSYSFASSPALEGITQAMVRYLRGRGFERLAVISATDASAQEADRMTLKMLALPENAALKSVAYEHFNNGDLTVAAQVGRIKGAGAQAMIVYASGPSFANILRAMKDTRHSQAAARLLW